MEKVCKGCGESKQRSEFTPCKDMRDRLRSKCKTCINSQANEWKAKNPERVAAYTKVMRPRTKEEKERRRNIMATPEAKARVSFLRKARTVQRRHKSRAHSALRYQVKVGNIVRPTTCPSCGFLGMIEGHHPDYERPLDVVWRCRVCHRAEFHRKS